MVKLHNPLRRTEPEPDEETDDDLELNEDRFHFVTIEEGRKLFDQQARKYLNMSGEEFRREYRAGRLDYEQSEVIRVSFLLPYAEYPMNDQTKQST